jgi:hypothetical protein
MYSENTHAYKGGRMAAAIPLLFLFVALLHPGRLAAAPAFRASLDRPAVPIGESATLTLSFEGGQPDQIPALPPQANLRVESAGTSRNVSIVQGQITSTITQQYLVTPLQPGTYEIPPLQAVIAGKPVSSPALKLTAVKAGEAAEGTEQPLALMRIFAPKQEVYTGEAVSVELQVLVREGVLNAEEILRAFDSYTGTPITAEGSRILRTAHASRRRAQWNGVNYTLSTLVTAISPVKTGVIALNSIETPLTLQLPVPGQRRRDMFDPFGMFQQTRQQRVVLRAEAVELKVMPLPSTGRPANFNGAVGSFSLSMEAGPTNVAAGDPVTLRIRLEGSGDLEALTLPEPDLKAFRIYPATSKIESQDPLQLQGAKIFEQVVVPQSAELKMIPGITFSFFDSSQKSYRTLQHPDLPLMVRPGGATPPPVAATVRQQEGQDPPAAPDIVPIKRRLDLSATLGAPMVQQTWFYGLQLVPVSVLAAAMLFRRRIEEEKRNPRLRRRREVDRTVRAGLADLRKFAAAEQAEEFFSMLFRLLQDRISERLDVPSSSITEAVVDDRLRPAGVPEDLLRLLSELFQACNVARYAPAQSSQALQALVPKAERALEALRSVRL